MLASILTVVSSGTASAAESIPDLQWPAVLSSKYLWAPTTSPQGVTNGCTTSLDTANGLINLRTYDSNSGQLVREIDSTEPIDDRLTNCIGSPTVDKNGDLYGYPSGYTTSGSYGGGPNLLAYHGNTLKWKYPNACATTPTIGADGNVYTTSYNRLIGVTPEVEPGTTQPKKVLDIPKSPTGCYDEVQAYKDGVAVIQEGRPHFYSYGGKSIGSTPSGVYLDRLAQINANGRVFYPQYVGAGNFASIKIVAYNPFKAAADWTAPESTFGGLGVSFWSVSSTPDGGAVVVIERPKIVAGAPSTQREYALVKLNALGQKVWEEPFAMLDTHQGSIPQVKVDTHGNIIVTVNKTLSTNDPYNSTANAFSIGVLSNGGDGNGHGQFTYDEIMRGNLDKNDGGVNGYSVSEGVIPGPGALYFNAECDGSCNEYGETKLYALDVPGLGLDYPRGAVLTANTPAQPLAKSYVALGDSYSSGEGVEPFMDGTDTSTNTCHRSTLAYANVISKAVDTAPYLTASSDFAACSGAVTEDITTNYKNGEPPQYTHLSADTKVVSLTIGGNDIGFTAFGTACVTSTCAIGSTPYATALGKINNDLPTKLAAAYNKILTEAPDADVYVLGYPQVAPAYTASDPTDIRCTYLNDGGVWRDAIAARDIVTKLDSQIAASVRATGVSRLHYVDVNASGSPFAGHTVCADPGESYFNNLDQWVGHPAYALHPNERGQAAYAALLASAL